MNNSHPASGFTLVELMIVVGIIGILASIAIPNFLKYKEKVIESEVGSIHSMFYKGNSAYWNIEHADVGVTDSALGHCAVTCRMYYGSYTRDGKKAVKRPFPADVGRCAALGINPDAPSTLNYDSGYHLVAGGGIRCWSSLAGMDEGFVTTGVVNRVDNGKTKFWNQSLYLRDGGLYRAKRVVGSY